MPKRHKTFRQLRREVQGNDRNDAEYDAKRRAHPTLGRAARMRSSARWKAVRNRKISTTPLCEHCLADGRHTAAEQVDHIRGIQARPDLAFTMSNLQSLCVPCHARKSARERRDG